ncbi:MAG: ABC transporter ATP-binding protein [Candidatus Marinimicrobia bacterium]|nr:ABC transporter ATP-binding protein [Candidatus Neomarinimicrobiota bacterium]MCF7903600.1 ABC transporter ATP-binding protein [Candidatus Neomarinimicrobiota bacterium]
MISIQNLCKSFGDLVAVDQLSLEIREGEILGFLGPNGAGKTTTIHMLCGLLDRDAGKILWNDQSTLNNLSIGFCPQENVFWPKLTCLEQMVFSGQMYGMPKNEAKIRGSQLLETLALSAKADERASRLSGGMKRRLNVALALIHDPEILIFDEPESGLDPQSRLLVRELIKNLAFKKTVIITSHNMDEIERLAHRVAIIDHGKLLKLDTVDNLIASVGDGDRLEISIPPATDPDSINKLLLALEPNSESVTTANDRLLIRSNRAVDLIPEVVAKLTEFGIDHGEVQLRKNSLEDVFIHLTGRGLRE